MMKDNFARFMALDALDKSGKAEQLDISVPMRVTFGEPVVLVPETTLEFHKDGENDWYVTNANPVENFTTANLVYDMVYKITFDGVEYDDLLCYKLGRRYLKTEINKESTMSYTAIGSVSNFDDVNDFLGTSELPFCIMDGLIDTISNEIRFFVFNSTASTHTLKIIGIPFTRKIVDERFYTNSDKNPLVRKGKGKHYSCIAGFGCSADGNCSVSMNAYCEANGNYSVASGGVTSANGNYSVAGGCFSQANGDYSVAFGNRLSSGLVDTQANGRMGVAIGYGCIADGNNSRAIGQAVHTNGTLSTGIGDRITANGRLHFAIGKYNLVEEGDLYAFSVGNGSSEEARSNAYTLDWEGNGCYQGKVESKSGILKLGETEVTEEQLKALLALLTPTA